MKLLQKTPFDRFYQTFLEIPYEARKDIFQALEECYPDYSSRFELVEILFYEVYSKDSDGTWKELFEGLHLYDSSLEF